MNCYMCHQLIVQELDNHGFETANYKFDLCLKCCVEIEEKISRLLRDNRVDDHVKRY
jgi:hypothetical protein